MIPTYFGQVSAEGRLILDCPALRGKAIMVTERKAKRSAKQNNFYWALLTVAARELGFTDVQELHDGLAGKLLALPELVPGIPRRRRTPKLNTKEFTDYCERCESFLRVDLGVDLSDWDAETARIEGFA